jgi:hypothetical protein
VIDACRGTHIPAQVGKILEESFWGVVS